MATGGSPVVLPASRPSGGTPIDEFLPAAYRRAACIYVVSTSGGPLSMISFQKPTGEPPVATAYKKSPPPVGGGL